MTLQKKGFVVFEQIDNEQLLNQIIQLIGTELADKSDSSGDKAERADNTDSLPVS